MVRGMGGQRDEQVPIPAANKSRNQSQWDGRAEGEVQRGWEAAGGAGEGAAQALWVRRRGQPCKVPWLPKGGKMCVLRRCLSVESGESPHGLVRRLQQGSRGDMPGQSGSSSGRPSGPLERIYWVGKPDKA